MKNAILLHGKPDHQEYYDPTKPSLSNAHWFPWLQKQLIIRDIAAHTPEVPLCFDPKYDLWRHEFERFEVTPETILVGHSCGAGFLVRWLSEHKDLKVGKVVLVAPWMDPRKERTADFFDFEVDPQLSKRASKLTIFNSTDDGEEVQDSVKFIKDNVEDVDYKEFTGKGHFTFNDLGTEQFPELLEVLVA